MKFIVLNSTNPHYNLAVEEYLFNTSESDVFMLWQNAPTVVIGKNQNAYAEVNMEYVMQNGIFLARRITGGGAVYHDLGNVNYTFISRAEGGIDFRQFAAPVINALSSLGVDAALSGRNDIEVAGKKISGNAQHRHGGRVLHHGTLLFDSDLTVLDRALKVDSEKLKTRAVRSYSARVCNLRPLLPGIDTVGQFIGVLAEKIKSELGAIEAEVKACREIEELYLRNQSREWLLPERDMLSRYSYTRRVRYPFGTVEVLLEMHNGVISNARISGDFFGTGELAVLEAALIGHNRESLMNADIDSLLTSTIMGMAKVELVNQIFS